MRELPTPHCPECAKPYELGAKACPCGRLLESVEPESVSLDGLPPLEPHGPPPRLTRSFRLRLQEETAWFLGERTAVFPVGDKPLVIGRRDPIRGLYPDIDLQDAKASDHTSRRHAQVCQTGGRLFVTELQGAGATAINHSQDLLTAGRPVELKHDDRLIVGETVVFRVERIDEFIAP